MKIHVVHSFTVSDMTPVYFSCQVSLLDPRGDAWHCSVSLNEGNGVLSPELIPGPDGSG